MCKKEEERESEYLGCIAKVRCVAAAPTCIMGCGSHTKKTGVTDTKTCAHTCLHTRTHTHTHSHTHTHTLTHAHTHTRTHARMHAPTQSTSAFAKRSTQACMCIQACVFVSPFVWLCLSAFVFANFRARTQKHTCTNTSSAN